MGSRVGRLPSAAVAALIIVAALTVDPFGLQSFLLLRYAFTLVVVGVLVWLVWRNGVAVPAGWWARLSWAVLLGSLLIGAVAGKAPLVALLGASGRQLGWFAWVVFFIAFVAGVSLFDGSGTDRMERGLVVGFSVALLGAAVVAALEIAGSPLVEVDQTFGSRIQSSFGNPAVVGAFVALALPVVAGGIAQRRWLPMTIPAAVAGAVLLVLSGTRGAWIGVAIGAAFGGVAVARRYKKMSVWAFAAAALLLVLIAGATAATGRWSDAAASFDGRVATWGVAADVVVGHPVVGVGPEGFATAFAATVDEEYVIAYTRDDVVDRAHNGILDTAVSGGIVAVVAYLSLLGWLAVMVWRAATTGETPRWVVVGAAAGCVAYVVQQQVFFQLAVVDIVFWLVAGLLVPVAGEATSRRKARIPVMVAGMIVAAVGLYAFVGVYADHLDKFALTPGDAHEAIDALESAASLRPSDDIHALLAAQVSELVGDPGINARAGGLIDDALEVNATNEVLILERSGLLVDVYDMSGNERALDVAQTDLDAVVVWDTTNGDIYLRLGAIAYFKDDFPLAESHWLRAQHLMPHRHEPSDNLGVLYSVWPGG